LSFPDKVSWLELYTTSYATPMEAFDFQALDYLSKKFPKHSITEVSQLLIQNKQNVQLVEAILGDDLYAASGEKTNMSRHNPGPSHPGPNAGSQGFVPSSHANAGSQGFVPSSHANAGSQGFVPSSHANAGGGTMFVASAPIGRTHSAPAPEPGNYSNRQPYVPLSQSYQMAKPPEYSIDPVHSRNHEGCSYIPSHQPGQFGRWSPNQPEYGSTQTPDRPRLDFRVPSSGSGYSDWSGTPLSGQSTPGSHRMPMFEMSTPTPTNTPAAYRQVSTPADYYSSSYHPSSPGDYRPTSSHSQDRKVYPSDPNTSWAQNPGHIPHPSSAPDLNYVGGRPTSYNMGRQPQYVAVPGHYNPVARPVEPLSLERQSIV
jgi:hypothetical protein